MPCVSEARGDRAGSIFDTDPLACEKAAHNLAAWDLVVVSCTSAQDAVDSVDIITTCSADKPRATLLADNMVVTGQRINAIGRDCPGKTEIHPDVLRRSDIFLECEAQTRREGERQQLAVDHPVIALWQVITGQAVGRRDAPCIALFDSVGFANEDFAALVDGAIILRRKTPEETST